MKAWLSLLVLACGCGEAAPPAFFVTATMQGILRDEVTSMAVYVYGPDRSDDVVLTCATLQLYDLQPDDKVLEVLAKMQVAFTPTTNSITLDEVASGDGRLVFVEARDASGLLANGCTSKLRVSEGKTTAVRVDVYRLP